MAKQTTEPQQEATAPISTAETYDQQLDVSVELQDDKLTNKEPPPALTQPPTALASIEPTAEEMVNLQTRASSQPENILAILEED